MKWLLSIVLLLGLAAGGWFLWQRAPKHHPKDALLQRQTTAVVDSRDIHFSVSVAGEISPAEQVSVRPEINGRIATLPVDLGDKVKRGNILFTLDDKELQNERSSALTEIDRARLELGQASRNFKRNQDLFTSSLISQELFETSKTDLALSSNALERAQRQLAVLEERVTKTIIRAPFDCTVLLRPVSIGQAVSGSGGVGGGTEVLAIADLNQMVVNAHVNQADVTRLKLGQQVEVQVEAVPGLKLRGLVDRIAPQATIRNNIKGFGARIVIKEIDPRIQPGMTANISIPVASADNVLSVPLGAVFTEQGERYVFVKQGEKFERRPVDIGVSDYFNAEVLSGLEAGEIVSLEQPEEEQLGSDATPAAQGPSRPNGSGPAAAGERDGRRPAGGPLRPVRSEGQRPRSTGT